MLYSIVVSEHEDHLGEFQYLWLQIYYIIYVIKLLKSTNDPITLATLDICTLIEVKVTRISL